MKIKVNLFKNICIIIKLRKFFYSVIFYNNKY